MGSGLEGLTMWSGAPAFGERPRRQMSYDTMHTKRVAPAMSLAAPTAEEAEP